MRHSSSFLRLCPHESGHLERAYFLAGSEWTKPQTTLEICLQKKTTLHGRNLKKPFKKILIMNTFYVRLSLTWVLSFQGPLLEYHEGTQNSCGKTKGAFQKSELAGRTMAKPARHFGNEIGLFSKRFC